MARRYPVQLGEQLFGNLTRFLQQRGTEQRARTERRTVREEMAARYEQQREDRQRKEALALGIQGVEQATPTSLPMYAEGIRQLQPDSPFLGGTMEAQQIPSYVPGGPEMVPARMPMELMGPPTPLGQMGEFQPPGLQMVESGLPNWVPGEVTMPASNVMARSVAERTEREATEKKEAKARDIRVRFATHISKLSPAEAAKVVFHIGAMPDFTAADADKHIKTALSDYEKTKDYEKLIAALRNPVGRGRGGVWKKTYTESQLDKDLLAANDEVAMEQLPNLVKGAGRWSPEKREKYLTNRVQGIARKALQQAAKFKAQKNVQAAMQAVRMFTGQANKARWKRVKRGDPAWQQALDAIDNLNTVTDQAAGEIGQYGTPLAATPPSGEGGAPNGEGTKPAPAPAPAPRQPAPPKEASVLGETESRMSGAFPRGPLKMSPKNVAWLRGLKGQPGGAVASQVESVVRRIIDSAQAKGRRISGVDIQLPGGPVKLEQLIEIAHRGDPAEIALWLDTVLE